MSIKDESKRASGEVPLRTADRLRTVPKSKISEARIRMIIDFMRANLHRKISLVDMGRQVGISASHVYRLFTPQAGIPPNEYLIRLRMKEAKRLLTTGLLSIKEIMAQAGYRNRGHFIEHFRRYFDQSPSEYRKKTLRS